MFFLYFKTTNFKFNNVHQKFSFANKKSTSLFMIQKLFKDVHKSASNGTLNEDFKKKFSSSRTAKRASFSANQNILFKHFPQSLFPCYPIQRYACASIMGEQKIERKYFHISITLFYHKWNMTNSSEKIGVFVR